MLLRIILFLFSKKTGYISNFENSRITSQSIAKNTCIFVSFLSERYKWAGNWKKNLKKAASKHFYYYTTHHNTYKHINSESQSQHVATLNGFNGFTLKFSLTLAMKSSQCWELRAQNSCSHSNANLPFWHLHILFLITGGIMISRFCGAWRHFFMSLMQIAVSVLNAIGTCGCGGNGAGLVAVRVSGSSACGCLLVAVTTEQLRMFWFICFIFTISLWCNIE